MAAGPAVAIYLGLVATKPRYLERRGGIISLSWPRFLHCIYTKTDDHRRPRRLMKLGFVIHAALCAVCIVFCECDVSTAHQVEAPVATSLCLVRLDSGETIPRKIAGVSYYRSGKTVLVRREAGRWRKRMIQCRMSGRRIICTRSKALVP